MASKAYRTWNAEAITTTGFATPPWLTIELITNVTFSIARPIIEKRKVCNFMSPLKRVGLNSRPLIKSTIRFPVLPLAFTFDFFPGKNRARFLATSASTPENIKDDAMMRKYFPSTMLELQKDIISYVPIEIWKYFIK